MSQLKFINLDTDLGFDQYGLPLSDTPEGYKRGSTLIRALDRNAHFNWYRDKRTGERIGDLTYDKVVHFYLLGSSLFICRGISPVLSQTRQPVPPSGTLLGIDAYGSAEVVIPEDTLTEFFTLNEVGEELILTCKTNLIIPGFKTPYTGEEVGSILYNQILGRNKTFVEVACPQGRILTKPEVAQLLLVWFIYRHGGFVTSCIEGEMYATIKTALILGGQEQHPFITLSPSGFSTPRKYFQASTKPVKKDLGHLSDQPRAFGLSGIPGNTLMMGIDLAIYYDTTAVDSSRLKVKRDNHTPTLTHTDPSSLEVYSSTFLNPLQDRTARGVIGHNQYNDWIMNYPFGLMTNMQAEPFKAEGDGNTVEFKQRYLREIALNLRNEQTNLGQTNTAVSTVFPEEVIIDQDVLTGVIHVSNVYGSMGLTEETYTRWFTVAGLVYPIKPKEVYLINPAAYTGMRSVMRYNDIKAFHGNAVRLTLDVLYNYFYADQKRTPTTNGSYYNHESYGPAGYPYAPRFPFYPINGHYARPDGTPDNAGLYKAYGIVNQGATTYYELTDSQGRTSLINRHFSPSIGAMINRKAKRDTLASTVMRVGGGWNAGKHLRLDVRSGQWFVDEDNESRRVRYYAVKTFLKNNQEEDIYALTPQQPHIFAPYGHHLNKASKESKETTLDRTLPTLTVRRNKDYQLPTIDMKVFGQDVDRGYLIPHRNEERFEIYSGNLGDADGRFVRDSIRLSVPNLLTTKESFRIDNNFMIGLNPFYQNTMVYEQADAEASDLRENALVSKTFKPWNIDRRRGVRFEVGIKDFGNIALTGQRTAFANTMMINGQPDSFISPPNYYPSRANYLGSKLSSTTPTETQLFQGSFVFKGGLVGNTTTWNDYPGLLRPVVMNSGLISNDAKHGTIVNADLYDTRRMSLLIKEFMLRRTGSHVVTNLPIRIRNNQALEQLELCGQGEGVTTSDFTHQKTNKTFENNQISTVAMRESVYPSFIRLHEIERRYRRYGDLPTTAVPYGNKVSPQGFYYNNPLPLSSAGMSFGDNMILIPTNGSRLTFFNGEYKNRYWEEREGVHMSKSWHLEQGIGSQYASVLVVTFDKSSMTISRLHHLVLSPGSSSTYFKDGMMDRVIQYDGKARDIVSQLISRIDIMPSVTTDQVISCRELPDNGYYQPLRERVENLILSNFGAPMMMTGSFKFRQEVLSEPNVIKQQTLIPNLIYRSTIVEKDSQDKKRIVRYVPVQEQDKLLPQEIIETLDYEPQYTPYEAAKRDRANWDNDLPTFIQPMVLDDRYLGLTLPGQLVYDKDKGDYVEAFFLQDMFGPDETVFVVKCVGTAKIVIERDPVTNANYQTRYQPESSVAYRVVATGDTNSNYVLVRSYRSSDKRFADDVKLFNGFRWLQKRLWFTNFTTRVETYGVLNTNKFQLAATNVNISTNPFEQLASYGITKDTWKCNHLGLPYLTAPDVEYEDTGYASSVSARDKITALTPSYFYQVQQPQPVNFKWGLFYQYGTIDGFGEKMAMLGIPFKTFIDIPLHLNLDNRYALSSPMHYSFRENKRIILTEGTKTLYGLTSNSAMENLQLDYPIQQSKVVSKLLSRKDLARLELEQSPSRFHEGFYNPSFIYTALFNFAATDGNLYVVYNLNVNEFVLEADNDDTPLNFALFNVVANENAKVFLSIDKPIIVRLRVSQRVLEGIRFNLVHVEGKDATVLIQTNNISLKLIIEVIDNPSVSVEGEICLVDAITAPDPDRSLTVFYNGSDWQIEKSAHSAQTDISRLVTKRFRMDNNTKG